jgi:hypothetical protein
VSVEGRLFVCWFGYGFAVDSDAAIGTNGSAEGTPSAFVVRIEQNDRAVAFAIEGAGQSEDIRGTRFAAKFTAFATLGVDYNSTFCHCVKLLFKGGEDSVFFVILPPTCGLWVGSVSKSDRVGFGSDSWELRLLMGLLGNKIIVFIMPEISELR